MARNFHPDRTDARGLQKNQRALELLLDLLFDQAGGVILSHADLADLTSGDPHTQYVAIAGRAGGQTVLQGLTVDPLLTIGTGGAVHPTLSRNAEGGLTVSPSGLLANAGDYLRVAVPVSGAILFHVEQTGNTGLVAAGSFGGGAGVVALANATTAPTTNPANGVILYSEDVSASARLKLRDEAGLAPTIGGVIFTQTAAQTVTNTTTETTIFGSGVGSLTLPANSLTVGRTFKVRIGGTYSTPGLGAPSLTIRVKIGSTVIASGTTSAISLGASGLRFVGELVVTCRSVGATGSVVVDGGINYNIAGSGQPVSDPLNNGGAATTVNTTVSGALDITVQWDAATTSRIATSTVAVVEVLN